MADSHITEGMSESDKPDSCPGSTRPQFRSLKKQEVHELNPADKPQNRTHFRVIIKHNQKEKLITTQGGASLQ